MLGSSMGMGLALWLRPLGPDQKSAHTMLTSVKNWKGWVDNDPPKGQNGRGLRKQTCFSIRIDNRLPNQALIVEFPIGVFPMKEILKELHENFDLFTTRNFRRKYQIWFSISSFIIKISKEQRHVHSRRGAIILPSSPPSLQSWVDSEVHSFTLEWSWNGVDLKI